MEQAIVITRSQLRQAIEEYIAASRVGETLSYVETAKLSAAEAAESSTERLWGAMLVQDSAPATPFERQAAAMPGVATEPEKQEFTCAEDLAAGQVVFVNSRGLIEGKRDDTDKLVTDDRPIAQIEFGFFQAEQLLGFFGGDTDTKATVRVGRDKRMRVHISDYPEEGAVELIDSVDPLVDETPPDDNESLFG